MRDSALRLVEQDNMDKQKALEAALGQIERAFGKGSVMKLGQQDSVIEIEAVSSGSLGLAMVSAIWGVERLIGADSGISDQSATVDMTEPIQQLNGRRWQSRFIDG